MSERAQWGDGDLSWSIKSRGIWVKKVGKLKSLSTKLNFLAIFLRGVFAFSQIPFKNR